MKVNFSDLFYSLWTLGLLLFVVVQTVKRVGIIAKAIKTKDTGRIKINSLILAIFLIGFCMWISIDRITNSVDRVWGYLFN